MKLIVGLGNFPKKYHKTLHNVGYDFITYYCKKHKYKLIKDKNGSGNIYINDNFILAQPLTYMNLSGQYVSHLCKTHKINISNILVICDEIYKPIGDISQKPISSDGGHNGIKNIIANLQTKEFNRLRIGVGPYDKSVSIIDFVMNKFLPSQYIKIKQAYNEVSKIVSNFIEN